MAFKTVFVLAQTLHDVIIIVVVVFAVTVAVIIVVRQKRVDPSLKTCVSTELLINVALSFLVECLGNG